MTGIHHVVGTSCPHKVSYTSFGFSLPSRVPVLCGTCALGRAVNCQDSLCFPGKFYLPLFLRFFGNRFSWLTTGQLVSSAIKKHIQNQVKILFKSPWKLVPEPHLGRTATLYANAYALPPWSARNNGIPEYSAVFHSMVARMRLWGV